jgi:hypothetical protein
MADTQIIPYKKCCEIQAGKIVRMFWEHPTGNDVIDLEFVLARWRDQHPNEDFTQAEWLTRRGFASHNVIRDGVRPPQP